MNSWELRKKARTERMVVVAAVLSGIQAVVWIFSIKTLGVSVNNTLYGTYAVGYFLSPILIRKGRYYWGRNLLIAIAFLHISTLAIWEFGREAYSHFWMFPIIAGLYMILEHRERWAKRALSLLAFAIFAITEIEPFGQISQSVLPTNSLHLSQAYVAVSIFIVNYIVIRLYVTEISDAEELLTKAFANNQNLMSTGESSQIAKESLVLLCQIDNFDQWAAKRSAREVVEALQDIFNQWDHKRQDLGLTRVNALGDAYIVETDIEPNDWAQKLADFALFLQEFAEIYQRQSNEQLVLQIGIHAGRLNQPLQNQVTLTQDSWGQTLLTSAQLSRAHPGRICISEPVFHLLDHSHVCEPQGNLDDQSNPIAIWWLTDRKRTIKI